jgi:PKD repeat protein
VYAKPGDYTVTLSVSDTDGKSVTKTIIVKVTPPGSSGKDSAVELVRIEANRTNIYEGESISFTGFARDLDGDVLTYTWDFGDGSDKKTGKDVEHTFNKAGTFTVTLNVTDTDNTFGLATKKTVVESRSGKSPIEDAGMSAASLSLIIIVIVIILIVLAMVFMKRKKKEDVPMQPYVPPPPAPPLPPPPLAEPIPEQPGVAELPMAEAVEVPEDGSGELPAAAVALPAEESEPEAESLSIEAGAASYPSTKPVTNPDALRVEGQAVTTEAGVSSLEAGDGNREVEMDPNENEQTGNSKTDPEKTEDLINKRINN